jgi:8-oxo-dGTP pyrophosphatase MutT (NUDIX family)
MHSRSTIVSVHAPRTIHLRRPPTLSVQEGVFVPRPGGPPTPAPPHSVLDEIESPWQALRESNPTYFDGRLCHVLGVHRNGHGGAVLHVIDCAYRFFAVQFAGGTAFDLGVRPLGVKGVVERDGRFLMGRRSPHVAMYQNMWEFAPSGSVDFGKAPQEVITLELIEETGLHPSREPTAIAVLFDPVLRCWEIVYRLAIEDDTTPRMTAEYPEVRWFEGAALPANLSPIARQIAKFLDLI